MNTQKVITRNSLLSKVAGSIMLVSGLLALGGLMPKALAITVIDSGPFPQAGLVVEPKAEETIAAWAWAKDVAIGFSMRDTSVQVQSLSVFLNASRDRWTKKIQLTARLYQAVDGRPGLPVGADLVITNEAAEGAYGTLELKPQANDRIILEAGKSYFVVVTVTEGSIRLNSNKGSGNTKGAAATIDSVFYSTKPEPAGTWNTQRTWPGIHYLKIEGEPVDALHQ